MKDKKRGKRSKPRETSDHVSGLTLMKGDSKEEGHSSKSLRLQ